MQTLKNFFRVATAAVALVLAMTGCEHKSTSPTVPAGESPSPYRAGIPEPLALALAPHDGESPVDKDIRRFQDQVRRGQNRSAALERLGWAFVAKARTSFDSGFYKLAEACAKTLDSDSPGCAEALLLRGHVLQNLHEFKEAEVLARELVAKRGLSFDYGLLGATLMEQGRIEEAVTAYQSLVDIRPDLQSYSRIAHVRWLTGDLDGAIEMMEAAVGASSPSDADSAAWANIRLASLELQAGDIEGAQRNCEAALKHRADYPPALLFRGKMLLVEDNSDAAISDLQRAAQLNPLPEYQWALTEALRAAGREDEAAGVEGFLCRRGAMADPRTLSLYLATRGEDTDLAVRLAQEELRQREDVFTHDAMAWALAAAGRLEEARPHLERALAEGTQDARLFFHAAVIESRAGRLEEAQHWFTSAAAISDLLLPSEEALLHKQQKNPASSSADTDESLPPSEANTLSASGY